MKATGADRGGWIKAFGASRSGALRGIQDWGRVARSPRPAELDVHPFQNRTFLIVWLGQTVSLVGSGISSVALVWWVYGETGSPVLLAAVSIAAAIPRVLLGPFAGAYVDRWDRRRIMLVVDALSGTATALIAALLFLDSLQVWHLYAFGVVLGVGATFHFTALLASVPNIVHVNQLSRANSMTQISQSASLVLGPAMGGILIAVVGVGTTFVVDAFTFFFASATLVVVAFPSPRSPADKAITEDIRVGFGFLRRHPALLTLLGLFGLTNFFIVPLAILMPVVTVTIFGLGPEGLGAFQATLGGGLLAGGLLFAAVRLRRHFGLNIIAAIAGFGSAYVLFGWSNLLLLSLAALAAMGLAVSLAGISSSTVFQREVPLDLQGRVFSARAVLAQGLQPVSLAVVGILAERVGIQPLLMVSGALIALVALLSLASAGVRRL